MSLLLWCMPCSFEIVVLVFHSGRLQFVGVCLDIDIEKASYVERQMLNWLDMYSLSWDYAFRIITQLT